MVACGPGGLGGRCSPRCTCPDPTGTSLPFAFSRDTRRSHHVHYTRRDHTPGGTHGDQTPDRDVHGEQIPDGDTHGAQIPNGTHRDHTHHVGHHADALNVEPAVTIAAAATNPMTVLRIVLTPLLLEKPQPYGGNSAVPVALPRAALGVRGGTPPWMLRNLLQCPGMCPGHDTRTIPEWLGHGAGAEPVQGFLARLSGVGWASIYRVL
jgi:hypothetical protein